MPYETGSASGPTDLLDKLRVFALANGWALDFWGARTDAQGNALLMNKGGLWLAFLSSTVNAGSTNDPGPWIDGYIYQGPYVGATSNVAQANRSAYVAANNVGGPYTAYHFFASGNYLHAVIEVTPGRFSHFGAGQLEKAGGGVPAPYVYGLRWGFEVNWRNELFTSFHAIPFDSLGVSVSTFGTAVRGDSDTISPRYFSMADSGTTRALGGFRSSAIPFTSLLMREQPSELTGRAPLYPALVMVERTAGSFSLLGAPPDLRFVRIDNMAPGESITIGSDQWRAFPIIRKNGPAGVENSGAFGFAYRVA